MHGSTGSGPAEAELLATAPPSKALEPAAFYSLYLGGLSFGDRQRRLRASAVLMLGGRLGLRPGELQHLHEGWIDWGRGELTVPERDPCGCQQCWETARHAQRAGDGRSLREIITESTWSPPGEPRTVPFGWSRRLTAILARLCETEGYLTLSAEAMGRLVDRCAEQAEGLDSGAVGFRSLQATSTALFADAGFSPRRVASLLGMPIDHARAVSQQVGGDARKRLASLFDETEGDPGDDYSLVADPAPFEREPFDPRRYDAEWRRARASERSTDPESLRNPRPLCRSLDDALDPADLGTREYLDTDSDLVDEAHAAGRLGQWVSRREDTRRGPTDESAAAEPETQQPSTTESGSTRQSKSAHQSQSARQSRSTRQSPSTGSESADRAGRTREAVAESTAADESTAATESATASESPPAVDDATVFDPRDQLSGPPVATLETRVACSDLADGRPTDAQVFLSPNELLFVQNGDSMAPDHVRIELSRVVDLSLDYLPSRLVDAFESTVTLAYDAGDSQRLAVVELRGNRQTRFANAVLKQILRECRIVVTYPARKGGRVLTTEAVAGTLTVDDRAVSVNVEDADEAVSIQLSDIIYFELEKQTFDEQRFRSLSVRHLDESGVAIKTTIALRDDRKHTLFQRFVRRSYQERKAKIEALTLTEEYKEVLVALYSTGEEFDISMVIDKPAGDLQELLSSLGQVGLVRMSDNGAVLTGLGHVVVNEKIEDVNV